MKKFGVAMLLTLLMVGTGCKETTTVKSVSLKIEDGETVCDAYKRQAQVTTDRNQLDLLRKGAKAQGCQL